MKKMNNALKTALLLCVILITTIACDKDFSSIGTDIIGGENFETNRFKYPVVTYNQKIEPVQTNALPISLLGVYNDPVYGLSTASFLAQLTPATNTPFFFNATKIDSVFLNVPYFANRTEIDSEGVGTYELDSIIGDMPIRLTGYRSNYYLRDFDPNSNFENIQLYYSNDVDPATGTISSTLVEGDLIFDVTSFTVDDSEIPIEGEFNEETQENEVTDRLSPRIRIPLGVDIGMGEFNYDYWKQNIVDLKGEPELSNSANFRNYFRGLYIKAEAIAGDGTLMLLDFENTAVNGANIKIYYSVDTETDDDMDGIPNYADADVNGDTVLDNEIAFGFIDGDDDSDGIRNGADVDSGENNGDDDENSDGIKDSEGLKTGVYILNFTGNSVNLFDNNFNVILADGDEENGDQNLFLKGGEGSMAVIDLFNGLVEDEDGSQVPAYEHFQTTFGVGEDDPKRLINEANLVFYVNQDIVNGKEPDRVYIYDLKNKAFLIDFLLDPTSNNANPIVSRTEHLGTLQREGDEPDGQGIKYKIRITEHLNNILLRDSTNVKLGLVVSGNINLESTIRQYDLLTDEEGEEVLDQLPVGSVITPRGTVLYGNATPQEDKKVELEIFYTEPDN